MISPYTCDSIICILQGLLSFCSSRKIPPHWVSLSLLLYHSQKELENPLPVSHQPSYVDERALHHGYFCIYSCCKCVSCYIFLLFSDEYGILIKAFSKGDFCMKKPYPHFFYCCCFRLRCTGSRASPTNSPQIHHKMNRLLE